MSRAAEQPLPPPPAHSVWARIEKARADRALKYAQLDQLAGRTQGHYRLIATRGKWSASAEVRDDYVRAATKLGFSHVWLTLGVGDPEVVAAEQLALPAIPRKKLKPPSGADLQGLIDRAAEELVDEDMLEEQEAREIVDSLPFEPKVGTTWEDIYEEAKEVAVQRAFEREREERAARREKAAREQLKTPDASFGTPGPRPRTGGRRRK